MQFRKDRYRFLVKPRGWLAAQLVVARVGQDTGWKVEEKAYREDRET